MLYTATPWADWRAHVAAGDLTAPPPSHGYKLEATVAPSAVRQEGDSSADPLEFDFVLSTSSVDRDHDTIAVAGWDLAHYQDNPVVLFSHRYSDPPVARCIALGKYPDRLTGRCRFPEPGVYAMADTVRALVRDGFLRTCSVGFRPITLVYNQDRGGMDFLTQELLEWSICSVPSNPDALIQARAMGHDLAVLRTWAIQVLDETADEPGMWLPRSQAAKALAALTTNTSVPVPADVATLTRPLVSVALCETRTDSPPGQVSSAPTATLGILCRVARLLKQPTVDLAALQLVVAEALEDAMAVVSTGADLMDDLQDALAVLRGEPVTPDSDDAPDTGEVIEMALDVPPLAEEGAEEDIWIIEFEDVPIAAPVVPAVTMADIRRNLQRSLTALTGRLPD